MTESQNTIRQIAHLSKADMQHFGGKASTLGILSTHGFAVPDGIALTAKGALRLMKMEDDEILSILRSHLTEEGLFAVRSSATIEDGASNAWAGLFSSFLNVEFNQLPNHLRMCASSAQHDRVQSYAKKLNIEIEETIPVFIQKMLNPHCAGVAFSKHPLYPTKNLVVIEAVLGTGEKLVSGLLTPEMWLINSDSGALIDSGGQQTLLAHTQIAEIADTVNRIASLLEYPVDVEWAIEDGKLFILQARPITALKY